MNKKLEAFINQESKYPCLIPLLPEKSYLSRQKSSKQNQETPYHTSVTSAENEARFQLYNTSSSDNETELPVYRPEKRAKILQYESLDFEFINNGIHKTFMDHLEDSPREKHFYYLGYWMILMATGIITGIVAFSLQLLKEFLSTIKLNVAYSLFNTGYIWRSYLYMLCICNLYSLLACCCVLFLSPVSMASGIPEVKAFLNGTNIPNIFKYTTIFSKAIGTVLSVSAGLAVGKEGPMVHTGGAIAASLSHLPGIPLLFKREYLKMFRKDTYKREFVSAGVAAGISSAFNAPIGGVLFSLNEASSYWTPELTWHVFFTAMISAFTMNILIYISDGNQGIFNNPANIAFGTVQRGDYELIEFIPFIIIGICGGLFGALFNYIHTYLAVFRRDYVSKKNTYRLLEVFLVTSIVVTLQFWIPAVIPSCSKVPVIHDNHTIIDPIYTDDYRQFFIQYNCEEGYYSPLASFLFSKYELVIKGLFHFSYSSMDIIPLLFITSILIGSAYGRLIGEVTHLLFPTLKVPRSTYAYIGAASMLSGITRRTLSLVVVLMEVTNDVSSLIPLMVSTCLAKIIGDLFTEGIYDIGINMKCIPFVESQPPKHLRYYTVATVMSSHPVCLHEIDSVANIIAVINNTSHNAFPVLSVYSHSDGSLYYPSNNRGEGFSSSSFLSDIGRPSSLSNTHFPTGNTRKESDLWNNTEQEDVYTEQKPSLDSSISILHQDTYSCPNIINKNSNNIVSPFSPSGGIQDSKSPICGNISPYSEGSEYPRGIITRNQLIVLLRKGLYMKKSIAFSRIPVVLPYTILNEYDFATSLSSVTYKDKYIYEPSMENLYIDLRRIYNPYPHLVRDDWPLEKVYTLFRTMGLRHLMVHMTRIDSLVLLHEKIFREVLVEFIEYFFFWFCYYDLE
ncbi:hypothetical protein WA158_005014 [Blastocystis sp. Blastoise]